VRSGDRFDDRLQRQDEPAKALLGPCRWPETGP
jgi:hypothetical protein